eukprot:131070-Chlamydomonas_euryale.AAC.1
MRRIVAPAARRFRPDAVIVSAGYDGHAADVLAGTEFQVWPGFTHSWPCCSSPQSFSCVRWLALYSIQLWGEHPHIYSE